MCRLYKTIVVCRRYFAIKCITHAQRDGAIQIQNLPPVKEVIYFNKTLLL